MMSKARLVAVGAARFARDLHHARAHRLDQRLELFPGGEPTGHRLVVRGHVADAARGREAMGAGGDRFLGVMHHRPEIVLGRFVGEGTLAHHVSAQRAVAHVARVVDALGQRVQHVEEFGESLPAPLDAGLHGGAADVLGALKIADDEVGLALATGRQGEAAVAHDHAGHALETRAGADRIPEDLRVHVGVAVDEARRHHVTLGVERFLGGRGDAADLRDLAVLDADVAAIARQSGTIDDHAVLDDEVECHGSPPFFHSPLPWPGRGN